MLLLLVWCSSCVAAIALPSAISIIHLNDVHSHIDQFNSFGTDCVTQGHRRITKASNCVGGYARIKTVVDNLRETYPENILLNAGDEFQGTMFYTYYKGEKTAAILNQMNFDAGTIGNHEFDDGPEHLAAYLQNLTMPVVCANINSSIQALSKHLLPYTIISRYQIGIIGLITPETSSVSSPGDAVDFLEPSDLLQPLIDELNMLGIKRIIALTHIGYGADMALVRESRGLSLVVGGHSHTFLGDVPWSEGPYPTVVEDLDGNPVPIVTNGKWGFNVGHLQVVFDTYGKVESFSGQPIRLLANETYQDKDMQTQIQTWKQPFLSFANEVVGFAKGSFRQMTCQITECSIGNLVADAMLQAHPRADVSMVNAGGLRAGLPSGNITRGQVLTVLPFGSTLVDLKFGGKELWDVLEGIVSWQNQETGHEITSFVQVSGMRLVYDSSKASGSRLISLDIRSSVSKIYEPVRLAQNYTVCTLDFMVAGGDFWWPEKKGYTQTEKVDDVLIAYLQKVTRVSPELDGRIADISLKGKLSNHAETIIRASERVFDLWMANFNDPGNGILKIIHWSTMQMFQRLAQTS